MVAGERPGGDELEAVVADLRARGVDRIVNLGDILSGPLMPLETARYLMAQGWPTIAGNHERQLLAITPHAHYRGKDALYELVHADGRRELVSEEAAEGSDGATRAGEATASLCLPEAASLFAERVRLEPLRGAASAGQGQALVLSSDGMRKSCLTDADFLELCGELCRMSEPGELEAGLAQITAEGSGDDVSVAMAVWAAAKPRRTGRSRDSAALQTSARKPAALQSSSHQGREQPLIPAPSIPEPKPWPHRWQALALLLALGGGLAAVGGWWWRSTRQPLSASHAPAATATPTTVPAAMAREIARQCAAPDRIRANLNQRRTQFDQLIQTKETSGKAATSVTASATTRPTGRIDAEHDPLGAVIAASRHGRLPGCTRLEQELRLQWQRAARLPAGAGQPGRMPAENGRPAATPATPTREP